jgi:hypothetical protein
LPAAVLQRKKFSGSVNAGLSGFNSRVSVLEAEYRQAKVDEVGSDETKIDS